MANVLSTTAPEGTQATLITQNQQTLDAVVIPEAGIGPTGPTGPDGPTGPTGASGLAAFTNLSAEMWVDKNTTVAVPDQDGNIETPFDDIQSAIDAYFGGSPTVAQLKINIVPTASGSPYAGITIPNNVAVQLVGQQPFTNNPVRILGVTMGDNVTLNASDCIFANPIVGGTGGFCYLENCAGSVNAPNLTSVNVSGTSRISTAGFGMGDIVSADVTAQGVTADSLVAAGTLTMYETDVLGPTGPTGGTAIITDLFSLARADANGAGLSAPSVSVADAPTVDVNVPVVDTTGAVAEVSVAVAGVNAGDTFAASILDRDGVAVLIGIPVCEVDGTVIFPVIADDAGTVVVRLSRLAVAAAT